MSLACKVSLKNNSIPFQIVLNTEYFNSQMTHHIIDEEIGAHRVHRLNGGYATEKEEMGLVPKRFSPISGHNLNSICQFFKQLELRKFSRGVHLLIGVPWAKKRT